MTDAMIYATHFRKVMIMEFDSYSSQRVTKTEKYKSAIVTFWQFFYKCDFTKGRGLQYIFRMEGKEKHFFKENKSYTISNISFRTTYFRVKNYRKLLDIYKSSLSLFIYNKSILILTFQNACKIKREALLHKTKKILWIILII